MPNISLVVCLYKERDLLERLLQQAEGCYDDLVVVHDGVEECVPSEDIGGRRSVQSSSTINPSSVINHQSQCYEEGWKSPEDLSLKEPNAPPIEIARDYAELPKSAPLPTGYRLKTGLPQLGSIHELVNRYGGRFYEGPRCFQQEPHWPFAWWAAKHDWILRLDADEIPSAQLQQWLYAFRQDSFFAEQTSGFLCKWPLWDGTQPLYKCAYPFRRFLINRCFVSFFGMAENVPEGILGFTEINSTLIHAPNRKSFGLSNLVMRPQAYCWRAVIAHSLGKPLYDLPRWQQSYREWPLHWAQIQQRPLWTGFKRFLRTLWYEFVQKPRHGRVIILSDSLGTALNQLLMAWAYWHLSWRVKK